MKAALPPTGRAESGAAPGSWYARNLLPVVWLVLVGGAVTVAVLAGLRIRRFRRLLGLGSAAPPALSAHTFELARRMGLRRAPPVLLLPARVPPMLWPGRGGPSLLIPEDLLPRLTEEERDTLLLHELAHVRRRDHWVRLLELAVTLAFWWYPVTWWVRRALRRAEERCCDEWVLRVMPHSARAYAEGLLKSLDFVAGEPDPLPIAASGAAPFRDLESRLKEILLMTPTPQLATPTRLALATAAVLGLAVFPTRAESPTPVDEATEAVHAPAEAPPLPPASPAQPADAPTLAPLPAPVLPAPPTPAVALPAPRPRPRPAPAPVILPLSPEDDAAVREIEEEHRRLAQQQAELHERELALAQERMAREAAARQEQLQAVVEGLRARGETERARQMEEHARTVNQRMELQGRQLGLERQRVREQSQQESVVLAKQDQLRSLQAAGRHDEARALRAEMRELEREHIRRELAHEQQELDLQREALEIEHRARVAEIELHGLESAGRAEEAEATRAEIERMRQDVQAARFAIQQERLVKATDELEREMESQLQALKHLQTEGSDLPDLQEKIERLEAALDALR